LDFLKVTSEFPKRQTAGIQGGVGVDAVDLWRDEEYATFPHRQFLYKPYVARLITLCQLPMGS